ncbi:MAG TPA: bifunctional DNA-binding transcriptional regulator/O6-methylguanine-DNA methyltransferase Ada [Silvibacterium sp.]|nr:bifunctional DNA-binding transcriptional regulator/O6-methylguanine-DNA methyltransferase Ada [Silvibacterium sp.]
MVTTAMPVPNPIPDEAWSLIQSRDSRADGRLFYGVRTTRVFCRPSCPSRRPGRANVEIFSDLINALRAGYRPCKRCTPAGIQPDAQIVQSLCAHLNLHTDRPVKLSELARIAALSPFTVQRLFQRVLGVSPAQYQSQKRAAAFRSTLAKSARVTDAIYEAGYSSSSRAYSGQPLGMKPQEFRNRGRNQSIEYATAPSPLGQLLIAATDRGLCAVLMASTQKEAAASLQQMFPAADLRLNPALAPQLDQVLSQLTEHPAALDLPLDLRATAFQMRVWQALRAIPRGQTRTYSQLAKDIGQPTAVRAVARACATNPASIVIPCHRVIGTNGSPTGYRWGIERKKKLLEIENLKI